MAIKPLPPVPLHPQTQPAASDGPPCYRCSGLCCRYFALQLDTPEDREDFDSIRWYLLHGRSWIWVEDGDWYLQVEEPCRYLGSANECLIYERRPQICREYGLQESREHPDDPLCDFFVQNARHDHEFRTPDELDSFVESYLAEREIRRLRRSEAAKRAWAERRLLDAVPDDGCRSPKRNHPPERPIRRPSPSLGG